MSIVGTVEPGTGQASVNMATVPDSRWQPLGYVPRMGTLNVNVGPQHRAEVMQLAATMIHYEDRSIPMFQVEVDGVPCHARASRDPNTIELLHPETLRTTLGVSDGDRVVISHHDEPGLRLSAAVMAHPQRKPEVARLIRDLDRDVPVIWDPKPASKDPEQRWANGRRAWEAYDPDSDWHLVIQDDALVCRRFLTGVELALEQMGTQGLFSAYTGQPKPHQTALQSALRHTRQHEWVSVWSLYWGVAFAAPTHTIPAMLDWCDRQHNEPYDKRIGVYYRDILGWRTWQPRKSLVEHRAGKSLIGNSNDRRAHRWVGQDGHAPNIDWTRHAGLEPMVKAA